MIDVPVYNMDGKSVGTMAIDEQALGGTVNPLLIKQAYVRYHANLRQGSARTLTRAEVSGANRKMYKQKGTGRGRHGNKKVPHFRGGGHAFAKKRTRDDFHLDMPKKMRRKANRNALLSKLLDNEVRVIDGLTFATPRTKDFVSLLANLGIDKKALVALSGDAEKSRNARLSGRNVESVSLCRADELTCFEMLNHRYLVIDKSDLQAWLTGPSSQIDKSAKVDPMGRVAVAAGESA
jgi:large subunit ribosomal protein L4